jgi:hypothetical protein
VLWRCQSTLWGRGHLRDFVDDVGEREPFAAADPIGTSVAVGPEPRDCVGCNVNEVRPIPEVEATTVHDVRHLARVAVDRIVFGDQRPAVAS